MRVLLDGDHARDRRGTGISTYARSLARGLTALGHDVSWLSGAAAPGRADPLSDAAATVDDVQPITGPRRWVNTAAHAAAGLTRAKVTARAIDTRGLMTSADAGDLPGKLFLSPDLYVNAHYRHMWMRKFVEVSAPPQIDVLHLTAPLPVTMKNVRRVVTIHDLVPIKLPYTTPDNKSEFVHRVRRCAEEADLIVTVSETSKADIVSLLDVDPAKIAVTYLASELGALDAGDRDRLDRTLSRFGLTPGGYLLFVGAQEPKKNLRRLIEAFLDVDTDMPLVLAGPRSWMWDREVGAALSELSDAARARIKTTGYVGREDLRRLYAGAFAFVFPSLYEGFGIPALDALATGCPAIVSKTGSLPEVCDDAARYVDPFDRESISAAIEEMIRDGELRASLRAKGPRQAERFSFEAYVTRLKEAYGRLAPPGEPST